MQKLTIAIPTYNRYESLKKNIELLENAIEALGIDQLVDILISDNHSDDVEKTKSYVQRFKNVKLVIQDRNIGGEKNFRFVVDAAATDWVMLMSDNDYIFIDYLERVMKYINDDAVSAIIPNLYLVDASGIQLTGAMDKCAPDKRYGRGDLSVMFKGCSMSGLCFRKNNGLIPCYDRNARKNIFPQVYFLAYNMLRGDTIHITETPPRCTAIQTNNWGYSVDNFVGERLKNVYGLGLSSKQEDALLDGLFRKEFVDNVCCLAGYRDPYKVLKCIEGYDLSRKNKDKAKRIFISRLAHISYMLASRRKASLDYWNGRSQEINFCWWGKENDPLHGLPIIIQALKKVEDYGIRFNLFLFGTDEKLGEQYYGDMLGSVGWKEKIHPLYGYTFANGRLSEFLAEKASIAFGLMSNDDKATNGIGIKSLDAIGAGIPLVTVESAAMREYFNDTCVYYCKGSDAGTLADTIIGILRGSKKSVLDKVAAAQNVFYKYFSTASLQKRFLQTLDD